MALTMHAPPAARPLAHGDRMALVKALLAHAMIQHQLAMQQGGGGPLTGSAPPGGAPPLAAMPPGAGGVPSVAPGVQPATGAFPFGRRSMRR